MPVFHTFTAGGKRYMFDANTNVIINLKEDLYFELEKYMQSGYKEITPAIEKLRDRGYLKDRADFEMVHPMDSTLEYSLERCIGTIALQVTQGCNLRCKYCAYSGSYDNRVHSSKRMSKEIAFKAIDFLFDHSIDRDRVSLGFYGGEPLLELDLIKECVKYAKKKSIGKELMFNITSNTTLITDEVLKFLYDNEFSLTVSLDGDRQAHDKNRVFAANGAGTFSVVMQILEKIQTQYPDYMERVHINAVIDPTTDFDCTSNFFSDYKTVKDFYIQANLISEYYRKDEVATDEEYREKFSYEIFKMYLQKLGRLENGSVKRYAKEQSHIEMTVDSYEPDWIYRAYISGRGTMSRAEYYFETVTGVYDEIQGKIDTVIAYSMAELENLDIRNKNLIYLGHEDIHNIDVQGFIWSKETRQRQIKHNHYQGNGLEVPVVILAVEDVIDKFYILTELKRAFANGGYNAYTIGMEPECVLYALEYMPEPVSDIDAWKNFIESQTFYKQSDLVIWCIPVEEQDKYLKVYPDCDVQISLCNEGDINIVRFSFEGEKIEKKISGLIDRKDVEKIYHIIEAKLTEEEDG